MNNKHTPVFEVPNLLAYNKDLDDTAYFDICTDDPLPGSAHVDLPGLAGLGVVKTPIMLPKVPPLVIRPHMFAIRFVVSGQITAIINGHPYPASSNQMYVLKPTDDYHVLPESDVLPCGVYGWFALDVGNGRKAWRWPKWLGLDTSVLAEIEEMVRAMKTPLLAATPELKLVFNHVALIYRTQRNNPHFQCRLHHAINGMLLAIHDDLLNDMVKDSTVLDPDSSSLARVQKFALALQTRYAEPMKYQTMARECGLSASELVRMFKTLYGLPPRLYITQLRMQAAQGLLFETRLTNCAIARHVGYTGEAQFYKHFTHYFNLTPNKYREYAATITR